MPLTHLQFVDYMIKASGIREASVDFSRVGCISSLVYDTTLTMEQNRNLAEKNAIANLKLLPQKWERL